MATFALSILACRDLQPSALAAAPSCDAELAPRRLLRSLTPHSYCPVLAKPHRYDGGTAIPGTISKFGLSEKPESGRRCDVVSSPLQSLAAGTCAWVPELSYALR
jgi:hypothetical protein